MKKICGICGRSFEVEGKAIGNVRYCSQTCREEGARRAKERSNRKAREKRKMKGVEKKEDPYTCKRAESCPYGHKSPYIGTMCDYYGITGEIRGGFAKDCKHYKDVIPADYVNKSRW